MEEPSFPPPAGPPVFVNVGPLTVPVLGAERIDQFVTLMVALELSDMITAEGVRAQAPRLTDAFLTTIYGAIASGKVMSGGVLDVPQVKSKLGDAATKVLGKDMVRDVLIQIASPAPDVVMAFEHNRKLSESVAESRSLRLLIITHIRWRSSACLTCSSGAGGAARLLCPRPSCMLSPITNCPQPFETLG